MAWGRKKPRGTRVIDRSVVRFLPAQEILRELLHYDPATGKLRWLRRDRRWFGDDRTFFAWNKRLANQPAMTALSHGYPHGSIGGENFPAHRVIWKWMTGEEPNIIDHINGDRGDNRWANLRSTTRSGNQRNLRMMKNNTSGRCGVSFHRQSNSWHAYIRAAGKRLSLGNYRTFEEAVSVRSRAEIDLGYHKNHGRAA